MEKNEEEINICWTCVRNVAKGIKGIILALAGLIQWIEPWPVD